LPALTEWWDSLTNVTLAGQGVSAWTGILTGRVLAQVTDGARPSYANGAITFNGSDEYLITGAYARNQPSSSVLVINQVTWGGDRYLDDGLGPATAGLRQVATTPNLNADHGGNGNIQGGGIAIGTWGVVVIVRNGASSLIQVGLGTPVAGTLAGNASGITLGAAGSPTNFANFSIKARGEYDGAWSAAQIALLVRSCSQRYGAVV
jgi:hypothetical protein